MDRANAVAAAVAQRDRDMADHGRQYSYGDWLQPIVSTNTLEASSMATPSQDPIADAPVPARRGRGRPRVNKPRDLSAIEKRRAQVREAQRTYQKRKEGVADTERKRCDEVLEVMSDLSTSIEALLQTASNAGLMNQRGELADQVRQLWSSYDTAINSPCVKPELRLLQVKNDRRKAKHQRNENFRIDSTPGSQPDGVTEPTATSPSRIDMDLVRVGDGTLLQPFHQIHDTNVMQGRNIFDIVSARQTEFRNHLKLQEEHSVVTGT